MKDNQKGVSLIESLMVVVLVGVMVFLMANLPNAMNLITKSKNMSLAREIAAKEIEDKRNTAYANLAADDSLIEDPRISLLPQGSGKVKVEFCDPITFPQFCPNDEQIKIVTVFISWRENNKDQKVDIKTFIGEGGLNQ